MENFIRTKYSSKRWVLAPTLPDDPSILDDLADELDQQEEQEQDSLPLAIVKQKLAKSPPRVVNHQQPQKQQQQQKKPSGPVSRTTTNLLSTNLIGNDSSSPSPRSTPEPISLADSPKPRVVSNATLLGMEFDSPAQSVVAAPSPTNATGT